MEIGKGQSKISVKHSAKSGYLAVADWKISNLYGF